MKLSDEDHEKPSRFAMRSKWQLHGKIKEVIEIVIPKHVVNDGNTIVTLIGLLILNNVHADPRPTGRKALD